MEPFEAPERSVKFSLIQSSKMHEAGMVNGMFAPSFDSYKTRSLFALDIPPRKTNVGEKSLFLLRPTMWTKNKAQHGDNNIHTHIHTLIHTYTSMHTHTYHK